MKRYFLIGYIGLLVTSTATLKIIKPTLIEKEIDLKIIALLNQQIAVSEKDRETPLKTNQRTNIAKSVNSREQNINRLIKEYQTVKKRKNYLSQFGIIQICLVFFSIQIAGLALSWKHWRIQGKNSIILYDGGTYLTQNSTTKNLPHLERSDKLLQRNRI